MATVLTQKQKDLRSISFGSEQGVRPHSLYREVADVRSDIEVAFKKLEQAELPTVIGSSIKVFDTVNTNSGVVYVSNFGVRSHIASVTINSKIVVKHPGGTSANDLTVEVLAGGAGAVSVGEDGNLSVITHADTTIQEIVDLINGTDGGSFFASLAQGANGGGASSTVAATSATNLSGGTGLGISASVFAVSGAGNLVSSSLKLSAVDTSNASGAKLSFNSATLSAAPVAGQIATLQVTCHTATSTVPLVVIAD